MNEGTQIRDHALENMTDAEALRIEDSLWWLRGRKSIINEYMMQAQRRSSVESIMDIGCGSGGNFGVLADFGRVIGVEPSEVLARRARSRGVAQAVYQDDAAELDQCGTTDMFTMFDVLEHIKDDKGFLVSLREKAAHKHSLLVSVPACRFLYGEHDRLLHHHRRYSSKTLRASLEQGGYTDVQMSYFMFFLFPLALISRFQEGVMTRLGRRRTTVGVGDFPPLFGIPFAATLRTEALLSRVFRFPVGLWLFARAQSPDGNRAMHKRCA